MRRRKFITTFAKTLAALPAAAMLPNVAKGEEAVSCAKILVKRVCKNFNHQTRACAETTPVWRLPDRAGYFFVAKMAIDADGAPRAYHPSDKRPPDNHTKALDWLANLSTSDRHGIQGEDGIGPEPGFVVSSTSLGNPAFPENDTRHWVDAETIPYIVLVHPFPGAGIAPRVRAGDCAIVVDLSSGRSTSAIFADVGRAIGEASVKTALNLGLDPTRSNFSPKVRGFNQDFLYIVFPDSKIKPPWDTAEIESVARGRFEQWGGMEQVRSCFPGQ